MKTINVNESVYNGSGWAIALIINDVVIDARYIDHPDTSDTEQAINDLRSTDAYRAAKAKEDAAYAAKEAADSSDSDIYEPLEAAFDAAAITIRCGMMSGTSFNYMFSARERAQAGIRNQWV